MFGIKFVKIYIILSDISDIGYFLLPDIGDRIDSKNPISVGPYN